MKKSYLISLMIVFALIIASCTKTKHNQLPQEQNGDNSMEFLNNNTIDKTIHELIKKYPNLDKTKIEKGVSQVAELWRTSDGNENDFEKFCLDNFIADSMLQFKIFMRLSDNFESLWGNFNRITLDLNHALQLTNYEKFPIDDLFGAYNPSAHLEDDFYKNKIAFYIILNFPNYTLKEKNKLGEKWSRKQWAYARMGDIFTSRVPSQLIQDESKALSDADSYIANYNIYMGNLIDDNGKTLFPEDLKLITHWGLRDELKSDYADKENGLKKQKMIYEVMKRIITQTIPECVINKNNYQWDPYKNIVVDNGKQIKCNSEPNTRYQKILNSFHVFEQIDKFNPNYPNYIARKFSKELEIPQEEVEKLFIDFVSSPEVKKVGELIEKRLGRNLEPYDIWYDGFKARSNISEDYLTKITKKKYPNPAAVKKDLPNILIKLGFSKAKANAIVSKVDVDPSRGAGHAWGSQMKSDHSHLRTRIGKDGMDYKGYNIAVHEFGHNTEQTISMNDVDYYMMASVPNTAFTEAWAFVFQKRDLDLLGIKESNPNKEAMQTLDDFWSIYEIMGVSLVDMNVWKWLYAHPNANAQELKEAVINIAKDVWNKYYANVFGQKDQPILAIYSHMIDYPLYLSAYPIGYLVQFQMESYFKDKNIGTEMQRMLRQGKLTPEEWMKGAVGHKLSIEPILNATDKAIDKIEK